MIDSARLEARIFFFFFIWHAYVAPTVPRRIMGAATLGR